MNKIVPFQLLNEAYEEGTELDWWGNETPKCPHCGRSIAADEMYDLELYDLDDDESCCITCTSCELDYSVDVRKSTKFDTNTVTEC